MDITFTTLSLVAHDAQPRSPLLEEDIDAEVRAFFAEHIKALQQMSQKQDSPPPGRFSDPEGQALFQSLHMGDASEFLDSAGILAKRLIAYMNKRTNRGLLACVRAENGSERISAVLKLEVVAPTGTTLEELASGEIRLATVTNVLEQPGELQKGALVASGLSAEEVICGDTLSQQSRYFPEAFGIRVFARPSQGPSTLLTTVARHDPHLAGQVATVLPRVPPGSLRDVVTELGAQIPGLDGKTQTEVIDALEQVRRPIGHLDTARAVNGMIEQGEILIRGPAALIHEVEIRQRPDGRWEAVIEFEHEPKITYR